MRHSLALAVGEGLREGVPQAAADRPACGSDGTCDVLKHRKGRPQRGGPLARAGAVRDYAGMKSAILVMRSTNLDTSTLVQVALLAIGSSVAGAWTQVPRPA